MEKIKPRMAEGNATARPTMIITPRSTPSIAATSSGPGVGGTSVCVIAPPVAIAIKYRR